MTAIVTTSWDDGAIHDLRIADMLARYSLRGTFYVPSQQRRAPSLSDSDLRELARHFEVGGHTTHHRSLADLSPTEIGREVVGDKDALEQITGQPARMFCYPRGRYNSAASDTVRAAGYRGARSAKMGATTIESRWRMPTTVQAYPHRAAVWTKHIALNGTPGCLFHVCRKAVLLGRWTRLACTLFDYVAAKGGVWHLYGHSWEIAKLRAWAELAEVLEHVSAKPDVLYLTNIEALDLWCAAEKLPSCSKS